MRRRTKHVEANEAVLVPKHIRVIEAWRSREANLHMLDSSTVAHAALRMSDGERGCASSHLSLWRLCASRKDAEQPILILEDDAVLCDDFKVLCAGCVAYRAGPPR